MIRVPNPSVARRGLLPEDKLLEQMMLRAGLVFTGTMTPDQRLHILRALKEMERKTVREGVHAGNQLLEALLNDYPEQLRREEAAAWARTRQDQYLASMGVDIYGAASLWTNYYDYNKPDYGRASYSPEGVKRILKEVGDIPDALRAAYQGIADNLSGRDLMRAPDGQTVLGALLGPLTPDRQTTVADGLQALARMNAETAALLRQTDPSLPPAERAALAARSFGLTMDMHRRTLELMIRAEHLTRTEAEHVTRLQTEHAEKLKAVGLPVVPLTAEELKKLPPAPATPLTREQVDAHPAMAAHRREQEALTTMLAAGRHADVAAHLDLRDRALTDLAASVASSPPAGVDKPLAGAVLGAATDLGTSLAAAAEKRAAEPAAPAVEAKTDPPAEDPAKPRAAPKAAPAPAA